MSGLDDLGWDDDWQREASSTGLDGTIGRVVRQDRGWVQVGTSADGTMAARTRQDRVGTPVVGDWVVIVDDEVAAVLARRSALRRADPVGEGVQVLAANLDRVLVVAGLDRPVKAGRIHRALTQAWDADAEPLIVLTKSDLVDDVAGTVADVSAQHPGTDVVAVSARTGVGVDDLRDRIGTDTVVLLGESGAGKSSLLNALGDDALAAVGAVRDTDAKGRHTTTRRELHRLPGGAVVVDTPGIRSLGVLADVESVEAAFADIDDLREQCRFRDCTHDHEPGCAVQSAVADGSLAPERLAAFLELRAEAGAAAAALEAGVRDRRRRPRRGR